ncbi:hypothetical protein M3223_00005 [Paenibacillus pasadenensis]|uniref:hypothetical protein n=1 Tax=Paenibacillus pasadenensis TaxID=217090 RepID=UPI00203AF830|nr:hypothetical protein [Paenibacillus pasadenensis]MCM3745723.1 hypothetical protein [Paenibacillus pasadenensis]
MKKLLLVSLAVLMLSPAAALSAGSTAHANPVYATETDVLARYQAVADKFAPDIHQEVRQKGTSKPGYLNFTYGYDISADFITNVNYDGDWKANNNWDRLGDFKTTLQSYVYYDVKETETHYFISYWNYYGRDDSDLHPDRHENDMEGMFIVVRKGMENGGFGQPVFASTKQHGTYFQYHIQGVSSGFTNGGDDFDGTITMRDGTHPEVFASSNGSVLEINTTRFGHNVSPWTPGKGFGGIKYQVGSTAAIPDRNTVLSAYGAGTYTPVTYKAIPLTPLWDRRNEFGDPYLFDSFGVFNGGDGMDDSANAPWGSGYKDHDSPSGQVFFDPAQLVDFMLNNLGTYSYAYVKRDASGNDLPGVYLYQHNDRQGRMLHTTQSIGDLRNSLVGDDSISSVNIIGSAYSAMLYADLNLTGTSLAFSTGLTNFSSNPMNDKATSVKVN